MKRWHVAIISIIGILSALLLIVGTESTTHVPEQRAVVTDQNEGGYNTQTTAPAKQTVDSITAPSYDQTIPAIEVRIAGMEAKFDQLAKAYQELERQLQTVTHANTHSSDSVSGKVTDDVVLSDLSKKQAHLAFLETELAAQGPDPNWSKQAIENIAMAFNDEALQGSSLLGTQCGKTLCRLEVRHADESSQERFFEGFFPTLRWETSATGDVTDNHDGTYNTVLFISRQDQVLPSLSLTSMER